ncbi:MAG: VTT domain-containing protein [Streptococcaceae bacterium]|jgi:uncharacterized membrane protein YdjX (TVP38/TMEM64 family)|nr:VTT domain-containing protein [Streptococcaceae bacterium]
MSEASAKYVKTSFKFFSILGILAMIAAVIWLFEIGAFQNQAVLKGLIYRAGIFAPIVFILIQIIQVVIPIIPGGIAVVVGVAVFGPIEGFIYNYVGIVLGSIILYTLGQRYGQSLVKAIVKETTYDKYMAKLDRGQKAFNWIFAFLIAAPMAPDDALVLIASQTKMSWRFFLTSIILGKAPAIMAYSAIVMFGTKTIFRFFGL